MGSDNNSDDGNSLDKYSYERYAKDKPTADTGVDSETFDVNSSIFKQSTENKPVDIYSYDRFSNDRPPTERPSTDRLQSERPPVPPINRLSNERPSNDRFTPERPLNDRFTPERPPNGRLSNERRTPPERQLGKNPVDDTSQSSRSERLEREKAPVNPRKTPDSYRGRKEKPKKKRTGLKVLLILVIAVIVIAVGSVIIYNVSYDASLQPVDPSDNTIVSFVVKEGSTTSIIADNLEKEGLIGNANFFSLRTKKLGYDGQFKPGTFSLTKSMSTDEIIKALSQQGADASKIITFTIPEGLTLRQTMNILIDKGVLTEDEFKHEVENGDFNYKFMEYLPEGKNRLEGFLYPETYEVFKGTSAHEVIDMMLKQFDELFTDDFYNRAKEKDLNVLEVVTIASLIERETMVDDERPRVAGVIFNRLEIDMKLQIDATIQYILPEVKEHLTYDDLKVDSPYNTYQNYGLPPGPICSPRLASIEGVLNPEDHDYIFYVLDKSLDGRHNFAETSSQFEKYKQQYKNAINKREQEKAKTENESN